MAKSLPRVRPGILSRSADLLQANLLMFLLDQMFKDDDEPIIVADLVRLTKEPYEKIVAALTEMTARGIMTCPDQEENWSQVGSFSIGMVGIETHLVTRPDEDLSGQKSIDFSDPAGLQNPSEEEGIRTEESEDAPAGGWEPDRTGGPWDRSQSLAPAEDAWAGLPEDTSSEDVPDEGVPGNKGDIEFIASVRLYDGCLVTASACRRSKSNFDVRFEGPISKDNGFTREFRGALWKKAGFEGWVTMVATIERKAYLGRSLTGEVK